VPTIEYANFYKVGAPVKQADTSVDSSAGVEGGSASTGDFVPTRRVREAPGGKSSIAFYDDDVQDDALAAAPAKPTEVGGFLGWVQKYSTYVEHEATLPVPRPRITLIRAP
jgi:hypothetical protein